MVPNRVGSELGVPELEKSEPADAFSAFAPDELTMALVTPDSPASAVARVEQSQKQATVSTLAPPSGVLDRGGYGQITTPMVPSQSAITTAAAAPARHAMVYAFSAADEGSRRGREPSSVSPQAYAADQSPATGPHTVVDPVRAPDQTIAKLLQRGDTMLALGDVSGARLNYERAAQSENMIAARRVGMTYDPLYLQEIGVLGLRSDPIAAMAWYRKAATLGDVEGARLLQRLAASSPQ
jgi:TPR repeat protein